MVVIVTYRTPDLLHAKQPLYQLSYIPKSCPHSTDELKCQKRDTVLINIQSGGVFLGVDYLGVVSPGDWGYFLSVAANVSPKDSVPHGSFSYHSMFKVISRGLRAGVWGGEPSLGEMARQNPLKFSGP